MAGRREYAFSGLLLILLRYYSVFCTDFDKTCLVDICNPGDYPRCSDSNGVILLRDLLNNTQNVPALGSCTRAGLFHLFSKVCNGRHKCQEHILQQIRNQCCRRTHGSLSSEKLEVTYNCINENIIYDVCSSHLHPVPGFHRHILSPNFTDETSRRHTLKLPFCQWSISIPEGHTLVLTINDLYVGPRTPCESETSFRLQYMNPSGTYLHLSSSKVCGSDNPQLPNKGYSREPISIPAGSTRIVVWFSPVSPKERLWFSYQLLGTDTIFPYTIPGKTACSTRMFRQTTTTSRSTSAAVSTTTDTHVTPSTELYQTGMPAIRYNVSEEATTSSLPDTTRSPDPATVSHHCTRAGEGSGKTGHLQKFILIGAFAGVAVVAVIFVIVSLVLFMKLISRSKPPVNGLVRFIKTDRLDSKPVVMEVECVNRSSPVIPVGYRPHQTELVLTDHKERPMSVHSSESPVYALPYRQPAIRYGSSKRIKNSQHRVTIVEDPSHQVHGNLNHSMKPARKPSPTGEEDMLSLISGCTVSSSGVSVSDGETAQLNDLINSFKDDSDQVSESANTKASSVRVRAEMRRPRFPPDVGTEPLVRLPLQKRPGSFPVANRYENGCGTRGSYNTEYDLCRPFPVSNDDYLDNPLYEAMENK